MIAAQTIIAQDVYWVAYGISRRHSAFSRVIADTGVDGRQLSICRLATGIALMETKLRGGHDYDPGWQDYVATLCHVGDKPTFLDCMKVAATVEQWMIASKEAKYYRYKVPQWGTAQWSQ